MFKYIIMSVFVVLFTACSAPKPKHPPSWYTSKPKDFKYFYAVGSGDSITTAKNRAIVNMRTEILNTLDTKFKDKTSKIKVNDEKIISDILKENEKLINTMSLTDLKIEQNAKFNEEQLVLIRLSRKAVFDKFDAVSKKVLKESRTNYSLIRENDPWIKQYSMLNNGMKDFAKLSSIVQAKDITLSSNNIDDIEYLNTLLARYKSLKEEISIYVLSDIDSRIYVKGIKDALTLNGIVLSSKPKSEKSLKLIIKSTTKNKQDYGFNRSESLVKYTTYDQNKNKVAFRQHTFSAKSRKSFADAKSQTAVHQKSMIKKLGVFNFIGVK